MADDKAKRGAEDRGRINVNEDYEVQRWSKKFGITSDQLRAAVKAVGDRASAVQKHLNQKTSDADSNRGAARNGPVEQSNNTFIGGRLTREQLSAAANVMARAHSTPTKATPPRAL